MGCRVSETVVDVGAFGDTEVPVVERHDWYRGLRCEVSVNRLGYLEKPKGGDNRRRFIGLFWGVSS